MTRRLHITVWLAFALVWGGCSLLVSPEEGEIKCEVTKGGKDPCPGATTCVDKVCKTIPAAREEDCDDGVDNDGDDQVDEHDDSIPEECDKKDNDCDGEVDEGFADKLEICDQQDNNCDGRTDEGFDQDEDGHTACGDLSLRPGKYDCEPTQAAAHPGAQEICDGLDNDCDGTTDNAAPGENLCPGSDPDKEKTLCFAGRCVRKTCAVEGSGETCKANERCVEDKCVPMDCATPCGSAQFCDMTTSPPTCKDVPAQRKIGDACSSDRECESRLCIDAEALNLGANPRRVCGKACCADGDCAAGETCFSASTGARSCLPRTMVANTYPAGSRACSALNQCPAPQVCAVGEVTQTPSGNKVATSFCRTPATGLLSSNERPVAEACSNENQCSTRLCQALVFTSVCTTPCNVSSDCAKLSEYQTLAAVHAYCQYVDYGQYSPVSGVSYGPMCFATVDSLPPGPPLKECRSNLECPDQTCIRSTVTNRPGKCAPTCCSNLHCTTLNANARCVPVARGTRRYEMRCMEQP